MMLVSMSDEAKPPTPIDAVDRLIAAGVLEP